MISLSNHVCIEKGVVALISLVISRGGKAWDTE